MVRSDEECVDLVLCEAARLDRQRRMRRGRILATGGGALVVANPLVVVVTLGMGGATGPQGIPLAGQGLLASVFADSSRQGLLVLALVGVIIGVVLWVVARRLVGSAAAPARVVDLPSRNHRTEA